MENSIQYCNECSYSEGQVTMVDCSNLDSDQDIFPSGGSSQQTVTVFFDGVDMAYSEEFFTLEYDEDKCLHPAVTTTGLSSSLVPSSVPSLVPVSDAPSGVSVVSSFATSDIVAGDTDLGHCYHVERYMTDTIYTNGCTDTFLKYTYYNGGMNEEYEDTGYQKVEYLAVEVVVEHSCNDNNSDDTCIMKVLKKDMDTLYCNKCSYGGGQVTMVDCSNLDEYDIFPSGSQTVTVFFDGVDMPYGEEFFTLEYDEDKCLHPAVTGSSFVPSTVPTLVPVSDAPSGPAPSWEGPSSSAYPESTAPSGPAPSWAGPSSSEYPESSAPSGPAPSWAGPSSYPSLYPDSSQPSNDVPVPSSFRCYNENADGIVQDGKCHATDIDHCIEEWEDGCTEITATYYYYNQYTTSGASSRELYYYITIQSASGCDPDANPDQPQNGCTINTGTGEACQECFSDGTTVSLVDCSNVPDIFDPDQGQSISLTSDGDAFDVVQTEAMCDHPAVSLQSDSPPAVNRGGGNLDKVEKKNGDGSDNDNSVTLSIGTTLRYFFFANKGAKPDKTAITILVTETIDFFHMSLMDNPQFADCLMDIQMNDIEDYYSPEETPDEFTLTLTANVVLDDTACPQSVSTRDAAIAITTSKLNQYIHRNVRQNRSGQRNVFFQVQKVRVIGVGINQQT